MYWDSVAYISAARSLVSGSGFAEFQGGMHEYWPPLYSLMLAAASFLVLDPLDVAAPLNAALFGLTVFLVGHWLRSRLQSRFLLVWSCLAVMLSIPLTNIASWALSETAFVLFVTVSLFQAARFLETGDRSSLVRGAVFTAAACLTRYVGVMVMAIFFLVIAIRSGTAHRAKMKQMATYAAISVLPVGLWILRNYLVIGNLTGARYLRPTTLSEVLDVVLAAMTGWAIPYLPANTLPPEPGPLAAAASALLLASVLALIIRCIAVHRQPLLADVRSLAPAHILGAFGMMHIVVVAVSVMLTEVPITAPRHLLPAYLPFLLASVLAMDRFLAYERERSGATDRVDPATTGTISRTMNLPVVFPTAILSIWLLYGAGLNAIEIWDANRGRNRALSGPAFTHSETLRYMRDRAPSFRGLILANQIDGIYIHTDGAATYRNLHSGLQRLGAQVDGAPNGTHVVWLHGAFAKAAFGYDASDLRVLSGLKTMAELSDGVVFQVDRSGAPNIEAYRSRYAAVAAGEPVLRSGFDVYLQNGRLTWIKKPCSRADTEARFHLYVTPADTNDLAEDYREYGFNVLDFFFDERAGARFDETCLVEHDLPAYPIARVFTAQWTPAEGVIWGGEFPVSE